MSGALIHRHYDAFELDEQPGTLQPTYRPDPYRERVFAIRELKGRRVEFVRDEGEVVRWRSTVCCFHNRRHQKII